MIDLIEALQALQNATEEAHEAAQRDMPLAVVNKVPCSFWLSGFGFQVSGLWLSVPCSLLLSWFTVPCSFWLSGFGFQVSGFGSKTICQGANAHLDISAHFCSRVKLGQRS